MIDISKVVDDQKMRAFHWSIVVIAFLLMLADGYDLIGVAFVAPVLLKEWALNPAILASLFGSGLIGGLFGPPLVGYLGDRYGRKWTVIGSAVFFGLFTCAQALATSVEPLMALRFVAGIGISAALPTTTALVAEFAPKRIRARMITMGVVGIALGGGIGGIVASRFMPIYGWPVVFWTGGVFPILVGILAIYFFPESIKFLTLHPRRRAELVRILGKLDPSLVVRPDTTFMISGESNQPKFHFKDLFAGRLGIITPLFWIANLINLMVFFFVNQWTPTLLAVQGIPSERAVLATALFQIGGFVGALAMTWPTDKWGIIPVPILFLLSVPVVAFIGWPGLGEGQVLMLMTLAGFCLIGLQFGLIPTEAQVYPTYIRGWGVGSCFAFARAGSVIGPITAGVFLSQHMPVQYVFVIAAAALLMGLIVTFVLAPHYAARMREMETSPAFVPGGEAD